MKNKEIIKELEYIESQLNEDTPNISDIRIDVAVLIRELTEPHFVSGCGGNKSLLSETLTDGYSDIGGC